MGSLSEDSDFLALVANVKGKITFEKPMASMTWLRVGGKAEVFFQPLDLSDLCNFLSVLPVHINVLPIGVCSNLLVRDGGISDVTVRLGRGFSDITVQDGYITVGAAALDSRVAEFAALNEIDLSFLRTIPGTIGGAVKMNAGCYGMSLSDVFVSADIVNRFGEVKTLKASDLEFSYRHSNLPDTVVVTRVKLKGRKEKSTVINKKIKKNQQLRLVSQPIKEKTGGSTFKNPQPIVSHDLNYSSAWQLIDNANLRGAKVGGAKVSELHSNFLINTGLANSDDFESLGEVIQKMVLEKSGIHLQWEIKRVGDRIRTKKKLIINQEIERDI